MIKAINRFRKYEKEMPSISRHHPSEEVVLLTQIRDLLKK